MSDNFTETNFGYSLFIRYLKQDDSIHKTPLKDIQVNFLGGIPHPFNSRENGNFPFGRRENGRVEDHRFDGHFSENNYE